MSQAIQEIVQEETLKKLATVCYAVIPASFLRKFIDQFPYEDGDFFMDYSELAKDTFQVQVYITEWHMRESQVMFLLKMGQLIKLQGYQCFRHWYTSAERKYIRKKNDIY